MSELLEASSAPVLDGVQVLPVSLELNTALINYRILVSGKEAGVIIGKNGDSITSIREQTNVKAGVSKLIEGCIDRILTVGGAVEGVSTLIGMFAANLIANNNKEGVSIPQYSFFPLKSLCPPPSSPDVVSLRLMVPNSQMGALIGKQGVRIKLIQEQFGVKLVASKDTLNKSTERIVEIQGTSEQITELLKMISKCLLEDFQTPTDIVYYFPTPRRSTHLGNRGEGFSAGGVPSGAEVGPSGAGNTGANLVTEKVGFPLDLVGLLIGKRGSRIQDVRRRSGATIIVDAEDNDQGERIFTITGSNYSVGKLLTTLNNYMEREKSRRSEN